MVLDGTKEITEIKSSDIKSVHPSPESKFITIILPVGSVFMHIDPVTGSTKLIELDQPVCVSNFSTGTDILIGDNKFLIAKTPPVKGITKTAWIDGKTIELPAEIVIKFHGIPLETSGILNVTILPKTRILLPAKTCLHQSDKSGGMVTLLLEEECHAILY